MAEGHTATVRIEGDSTSLERAASRSEQAQRRLESAVTKTGGAAQRTAAAVERSSTALAANNVAADRMQKATARVGFALHQVVGQTASFNTALQGVLGTFGGWGVAIGAAAGVVLHFANAQDEAKKKTIALNEEMRKQAGLRREAAQDFAATALLQRQRLQAERAAEREEKARKQIEINHREQREFNEEQIIADQARGKSAEAFRRIEAEREEQMLREQAAVSSFAKQQELTQQADAVAREEKLRRLEAEGRHEKEITKQKKEQFRWSAELLNQARMAGNMRGITRATGDSRDIAAAQTSARAAAVGGQMQRVGADGRVELEQAQALSQELRAIEMERAQAREFDLQGELDRIEREKQANIDFLTFKEQVAANEGERMEIREQKRQTMHEAELARMAEEQAAIQRAVSIGTQAATQTVMGVLAITDARRNAIRAAKQQGATDAEAAKAGKIAAREALAAQLLSLRNLAVTKAIEQTALGIGALATTWGVPNPSAALHFAAAATWGVVAGGAGLGARAAQASADRMSGSGGSFGGGTGGTGSGGSGGGGSNLPPGSNSPIPGSPGPQAPSSGGGNAGAGNGPSLNFNGAVFHLYGAGGRREFIRELDQDLGQLRHDRPRRSG